MMYEICLYYVLFQIVTANCVPVVVKDMVATNGIIHSVQNLLPTAKKSLDQIVLDNPQLTQLSKGVGVTFHFSFLSNTQGFFVK